MSQQRYICFASYWPLKLVLQLQKLKKYYEIIVFTILPKKFVDMFYEQIPDLKELIDHTLTYEDLVFDEENHVVYKDLSLITGNRNFHRNENEEGEIIVIDTKKREESVDTQFVTYFEGV